ncbi:hypothetical protein GCM10010106_16610 [Thermopolyspora flexuosa]|uniref:Helix-turn-helix protein n=1 Tax=Thermopolyspora flexuosa TaxID=103836 RepID=A0A543J4J5_9ACTN|nr:helix-turn-helix transcriptional regulator [Thermopolyspora flexuosa]TQM77750.1 hypothetical protein FHX40_4521 [Thermopolyspora flexuosa]GGM70986.1 hypothetical protein GCM10010106_16610 [Thermopolyspora flexuosa]
MSGQTPRPSSAQLFGAVLRAFRRTGLREVAARLPISWGHLARIERGEQPVPPDLIPLFDVAYQANGALIQLSELLARDKVLTEWESKLLSGTFPANPSIPDEDDMQRRALLRLLSVLGPGAAVSASTIDAVHVRLRQITGEWVDRDADDWEQVAWDYAQGVWTDLSGTRSADLAADIHDLSRDLAGTADNTERASLLRVYAQLSAFLALDLPLIAGPRACWRAWSAARAAADASGDKDLAVWVRAEEAADSYYMKRLGSATENLVAEAVALADGRPSIGLVKALDVHSRIFADQGKADDARRTLGELEEVYAALPAHVTDDHISVWGKPPEDVQWSQAWVLTKLGDVGRATPLLEQALASSPQEKVGGRTNINLVRMWGAIQDGEVTEGLDRAVQLTQSLPVTPARRRIVGEILTSLPEKAQALPAARELRTLVSAAAA